MMVRVEARWRNRILCFSINFGLLVFVLFTHNLQALVSSAFLLFLHKQVSIFFFTKNS